MSALISERDKEREKEDSKGLWVPTRTGAAAPSSSNTQWYFIDENRAYRGPVSKQTLHYLFSTHAISRNTYVFTEQLTESREWIRIRKLPHLLEELQKPLRADGVPVAQSAPPNMDPNAQRAGADAAAAGGGGAHGAPSGRQAEAQSGASGTAAARAAAQLSMDRAAPLAADSPMVATHRVELNMAPANLQAFAANSGGSSKKLSELISSTSPSAKRKDKGPGFSFKNMILRQPKYKFGLPLHEVRFGEDGVPEILTSLRNLLWEQKGHLIEGIFRVPPSASALKLARQNAENGSLEKITDMESVAQLIKLWFRELPDSIFGDCLPEIVDGPPREPVACAKIVQRLPDANRKTIYWLLQLITDICRYESDNRMTAQSMTIVLAPNLLLAPPTLGPLEALELNTRVVQFTELLFQHWNSSAASKQQSFSHANMGV
uniref:Rho-GAP domain-containing protein n=1 Tax=Chrysotila carterae TaxID=13221 RepID=A0A7S4F5H1_CHRCT|mmetsp:Transcript_5166/g.11223  ORF Transcript_5166/g.11223 Transcript_5166/m.11223 type:complete len:434 (+) Transcript_5166:635-1936(+)